MGIILSPSLFSLLPYKFHDEHFSAVAHRYVYSALFHRKFLLLFHSAEVGKNRQLIRLGVIAVFRFLLPFMPVLFFTEQFQLALGSELYSEIVEIVRPFLAAEKICSHS